MFKSRRNFTFSTITLFPTILADAINRIIINKLTGQFLDEIFD